MSDPDYREPTNEQLWAQPPAETPVAPGHQSMVPAAPPPLPASITQPAPPVAAHRTDRTPFVLAIVSMALGIPLTAISSSTGGLLGLLIVWIGIVAVNVAYGWSRRN